MHDYLALTTQRGSLSALAILDVLSAGRYTLMTGGAAEPITGCRVSAAFFAVLGVSPRKAYTVWAFARAWLFRALGGDPPAEG